MGGSDRATVNFARDLGNIEVFLQDGTGHMLASWMTTKGCRTKVCLPGMLPFSGEGEVYGQPCDMVMTAPDDRQLAKDCREILSSQKSPVSAERPWMPTASRLVLGFRSPDENA